MRNSTIAGILIGVFIAFFAISAFDETEIKDALDKAGLTHLQIPEDEVYDQFEYYVAKYSRSYNENSEFENRFQIFKQNYQFIMQHNANAHVHGYTLGVNKMADMTNEEYQRTYLGYQNPNLEQMKASAEPSEFDFESMFGMSETDKAIKDLQIPSSVDWHTKGILPEVKDQGECGSCYAFSAISAIEGLYRINNKNNYDLSEQQVIDCSDDTYGNLGCNGGTMTNVFAYAHKNDLCSEEDYPYEEEHNSCMAWLRWQTSNYISGYTPVESYNRLELYKAIAQQPVSMSIDASGDTFRFYQSGIMASGCEENLNHGVTAVGYGTSRFWFFFTNNFVKIRNSWGSDWGESGHIRLGSNTEIGYGICGIYMDNSYPGL